MSHSIYTRPTKTRATSVGDHNRSRWSRKFRQKLFGILPTVEFLAAEENAADRVRRFPGEDKAAWATTRLRLDQMAAIEVLQKRHLKATGKEISRAEVLAALMAEGLPAVVTHPEFCGSGN